MKKIVLETYPDIPFTSEHYEDLIKILVDWLEYIRDEYKGSADIAHRALEQYENRREQIKRELFLSL